MKENDTQTSNRFNGNNIVDAPIWASAQSWDVRPFQIVSLLDMFKFRIFDLLAATWHLEVAQENAAKRSESAQGPSVLDELDQKLYQQDVQRMRLLCEKFDLESSLDQLKRIDTTIEVGSLYGAYNTFTSQTQQVWECLQTDLDKRSFLFMPTVEAKHYGQEELFGAEVKARFPKANHEITEAGNCYATGNNTACVFHLMRAVEHGARVLVQGLRVTKRLPRKVELCDWGDLISALESGLKTAAAGRRKSLSVAEKSEFYNHAVGQLRNFKDAWRNAVAHTRKIYKPGETKDIMDNTRQFMQHLATRLKE